MEKRKIHIKKVGDRWMVIRERPRRKFLRGQRVEWTLHAPRGYAGERRISAHFQFTEADLVKNPPKKRRLTRDLTAVIPKPGEKLTLDIRDSADRRKNPRHYAVWIVDSTLPSDGVYAVGESGNPPPELVIGP